MKLNDTGVLIILALLRLALHTVTNGEYGFHRDELAVIDDAQYLAWGYVAYPPVTVFLGRLGLELFGLSLVGIRLFTALAQCVSMVIAGLIARELGGSRWAQVVASLAAAIAPFSLIIGVLFQYVSFDFMWWVLTAYFMIRLLKSDDPRWWLAIGATLGLGMMTKYTIAFLIAGLVVGVLLTPARRHLKSPWLWAGVGLSLVIFVPNLIWQIQHDFVTLEFLASIHERDVRIGRAEGFLVQQLYVSANVVALPFWLAGLYFYFIAPDGRRYRPVGWMYIVPLVLFMLAKGRFYYVSAAYPMLIAAGAVVTEKWLYSIRVSMARIVRGVTWGALAAGGAIGCALMLPVAPVNSGLWNVTRRVHDGFVEQIGWPELVETVAQIYAAQPDEEKPHTGILAANYGEAGAINLFGPAYGLPRAISGINSYWERGYGDPPPETLIVVGLSREEVERFFTSVELAGHTTNRYGVKNEETEFHPDIFLCRGLRMSWPEFWEDFRYFG